MNVIINNAGTNQPTSGTFTLGFGKAECELPHDCTQEEVDDAVSELIRIDEGIREIEKRWPR